QRCRTARRTAPRITTNVVAWATVNRAVKKCRQARSTEMIIGINIVAVPVDDIDEALDFYCDVLRMEKRKDAPTEEGNRYVEVAPAGSSVSLSPYTYYDRPPKATIGEYSRVVLRVDDVAATYEDLRAKGVRF